MAPAYYVLHNRVTDDEQMQEYLSKVVGTIFAHGGEILVVAEDSDVIEGTCEYPRTVVLRFPSREQATAWYDSPEYVEMRPLRIAATEGFGVLVDGFEMPA